MDRIEPAPRREVAEIDLVQPAAWNAHVVVPSKIAAVRLSAKLLIISIDRQ